MNTKRTPSAVKQAEHHLGLNTPSADDTHLENGIVNALLFTAGLIIGGIALVLLLLPLWNWLDTAPLTDVLVVLALFLALALVVVGRLKRNR